MTSAPLEKKEGWISSLRSTVREILDLAREETRFAQLVPDSAERREFHAQLQNITRRVSCPHNPSHVLAFINEILAAPKTRPGVVVECGCFKGGSTAKFSLFTKRVGRPFHVFDSFQGIPDNEEAHKETISGTSIEGWFAGGSFSGGRAEVERNVREHGVIDGCRFIEGWFEETLPHFREPICAAYVDVDLASSTRTCLKYLYPLLVPGGVICSQDGDFPLVIEALKDARFWREEVGGPAPIIDGLDKRKIVRIFKPQDSSAPATA